MCGCMLCIFDCICTCLGVGVWVRVCGRAHLHFLEECTCTQQGARAAPYKHPYPHIPHRFSPSGTSLLPLGQERSQVNFDLSPRVSHGCSACSAHIHQDAAAYETVQSLRRHGWVERAGGGGGGSSCRRPPSLSAVAPSAGAATQAGAGTAAAKEEGCPVAVAEGQPGREQAALARAGHLWARILQACNVAVV